MVACHHEGWHRCCGTVSLGASQERLTGTCLSPLLSLALSHLPAALPSSTLLTKIPSPCSEPPRTLKPSLPSTLFSTVIALMMSLSLLLAVGTGDGTRHLGWVRAMAGGISLARDVPSPRTTLPAPRPREPRRPGPPVHAGGRRAATPHAPSMGVLMRMTRPMGDVARLTRVAPLSRRLCLLRRQRGARLASLLELRDRLPAVIPDSVASQPWAMAVLGTPASRRLARGWPRPHGAGAARRPGGDMA